MRCRERERRSERESEKTMKDDFTVKTRDFQKERERKGRSRETERCRARGKKSLTQRKSYIEIFGSKEREEGREGGRDSERNRLRQQEAECR